MNSDGKAGRDIEQVGVISEMAIVDVFTRLIFGEQGDLSPHERLIIDAFREVDTNVLLDSIEDMGGYLRSLGVREMIHLVARIREELEQRARDQGGAERNRVPERRGAMAGRR
jgi:hypothetical protein